MTRPSVDFIHARRTPLLGWAILSAGAVGLALALWMDDAWTQHRSAMDAEMRAHAETRRLQALQATQRSSGSAVDVKRQQFAARQLAQPWLPALRLIENATEPPVFIIGLSMDSAAGTLRLDGEAPGLSQALGYAKALHENNLLGPVELRSHESGTDPQGDAVLRFSLHAAWGGRP